MPLADPEGNPSSPGRKRPVDSTRDTAVIVHVVDDDPDMVRLLRSILERYGLRVCTWRDPRAFLADFCPGQDACLVLDLRMPEMGGVELLEVLRKKDYGLPVVILTGEADIPTTVQAVKLGATDVMEKPFAPSALMDAVQRALGEDAAARLRRREEAKAIELVSRLTPREREVLQLLAQGHSLKQAAQELHRSYKTLDNHRGNLMKKLGVHDRVELARLAIRAGVVEA